MATVTPNISIDVTELDTFVRTCEVLIHNAANRTQHASKAMGETILARSKIQVPKNTLTLMNSGYVDVRRRELSGYVYEAAIGYGGNGDPINPNTGERASEYMVEVHEDLYAYHSVGKAKFLEDPVNEYANGEFKIDFDRYVLDKLWSPV